MANQLSNELLTELYGQVSSDPYLTLFTLTHPSFTETIRLVNNSEDIVSNGETFIGFPVRVVLPPDDNETAREVNVQFDNISLELIDELRAVTTPIDVKIEMVLASNPDVVQQSIESLKFKGIQFNTQVITAKLVMDDFLNVGLTSERYTPTIFPGIF